MKTMKKIILGLLIPIAFGACKKELQLEPTNSFPAETAFSSADKCLTSLYGIYDAAQGGQYTDGTFTRGYPFGAANIEQGDCRGEDVVNIAAFYQVTYENTYNPTTANNVAHWNTLYALINKANVGIDGFKGASGGVLSTSIALQYEAECRFLRALAHHELLMHYARPYVDNNGQNPGVPYRDFAVTSLETVEKLRSTPRMRVDSCYIRILQDLDFAETNLLVGPTPSVPNPAGVITPVSVRATKAVAIALKMRIRLFQGNWAAAITEGNKLVNPAAATPLTIANTTSLIGGWQLTSSPDGPFANNTSSESMFSIRNDALDNPGTNGALPTMYGPADLGARGLVAISPIIYNNTGWLCDDKRRTLLTQTGTNNINGQSYFSKKYTRYGTREDFSPQVRYAEVLLTLAEAEARTTFPNQRAVDLLNVVRNRSLNTPGTQAYTLASFPTQVDLVRAILLERRIEFLAEGKRWGDVTRTVLDANYTTGGIPGKVSNGSQGLALYSCGGAVTIGRPVVPYSSYLFIWPIPGDEIIQNPIITQNPSY